MSDSETLRVIRYRDGSRTTLISTEGLGDEAKREIVRAALTVAKDPCSIRVISDNSPSPTIYPPEDVNNDTKQRILDGVAGATKPIILMIRESK